MSKSMKRANRHKRRLLYRQIEAAFTSSTLELETSGTVEIEAAGEGEANKTPRFSMVAYSGSAMRPGGWKESSPLVLDVTGMKSGDRVPIHRDHDRSKVVGHSESIKSQGGKIIIEGLVSAQNQHADEAVGSSRKGFPWQASVGANLNRRPEFVAEGKKVDVNGRTYSGPVYIARSWTLKEASFVSLGADSRTGAVAAGEINMTGFEKWVAAKGFEVDDLNDTQVDFLKSQYDSESEDKSDPVVAPVIAAADDDNVSAADAERFDRLAYIQEHLDGKPALQAQAVREKWTADKCQLESMRSEYSTAPAIHVKNDQSLSQDAVEARLSMGLGTSTKDLEAEYDAKTLEAAETLPSSAGLQYLIHQVIRASGKTVHSGTMDNETIRAAFTADREITAAGGFSTIGLANTLSNLAHKRLLRAYNEYPSVFRAFAAVTSHTNFKQHSKNRVTNPGTLDKLGPTGEIKHTELDEDSYFNKIETYARMMAITRAMIIDDDLNALANQAARFGRMAARTLERDVFTVLLDNTGGFYDASATLAADGHMPNMLSGASSVLSLASLGAAETLFWSQTDKHGNPIDLMPSVLLTGQTLKRDADNLLNRSTVTVAGDPATTDQLRVSNEFSGEFRPIMSPYLESPLVAGSSTTHWFLFASPSSDVAAIEVAFLRGRQAPTVETAQTDFNTLGIQTRAYMDWGVAKQDPRAVIYSAGA